MGLNEMAVSIGKLEERVNALERDILAELSERKENQKEIRASVEDIKKKVWVATGFIMAVQIGLSIFLKWVFK